MNNKHRAPVERIFKIIQMVKKGGKLNASIIAQRFEVDRKTIQRDITFIRDRLSIPVTYNPQKHSFELS